jgi:hypothetical protein
MSSNMSNVIDVNSLISVGLSKMIRSIVCEAVIHCGSVHNFDSSEMIRSMNLADMHVNMNASKKEKVVVVKEKVVVVKEKVVVVKSKLPMPFNGSLKENCCSALRQNQGLYTQCETTVSDCDFCKKCGPSPTYGTIQQRLEVGIMEFRDPKGKAPTPFAKIMKKLNISREEVEEEAGKLNIILNDIHFEQEEIVEKKEKGRPKKPRRKIELADDSTDLFAALVAKANEDSEDEISDLSCDEKSSMAESIIDSVLDKVSVVSENNEKKAEKEAAKLAEKAEKEAAKLALIQKKESELAEKEAAKLAEKEAAKLALIQKKESDLAEKEAAKVALIQKKESDLAEKEAAKVALIQKKESELAEKEAAKLALIQKKAAELVEKEAAKVALIQKKESEKAEKEAAKVALIQKKEEKKPVVKASAKAKKDSEIEKAEEPTKKAAKVEVEKPTKKAAKVEAEEQQDVVKRFEFEGVKYLKSKNTGIIYNLDEEVIGKWNEKTSKIDFDEAGSEEEEDEYEE